MTGYRSVLSVRTREAATEGMIVSVISRAHTHIVGRLVNENGVWLIAPEDRRIVHDILVDGSPGNAKAGQIVNAQLVSQPSRYTQPVARIVEVLGGIDDPGIEIEIAVAQIRPASYFFTGSSSGSGQIA